MSAAVNKSIIDLLMAGGVASREEAAQLAQNLNGGSWTTQVLDSGKVDEQRFLTAIGNFFRVPVVALDAKAIDRQTLSILPPRFVFQHHILPIEEKENSVVLATYDLFNSAGRQLVTQLLKKPAEWVLVPRTQLLRAMKTLYGVGAETFDEILKTNRAFEPLQESETSTDLNADDPEASVVKFVNQIIREAIVERATDIHVEPLENDLRIRYRIDGILHEVAVPPQLRLLQSAIISRLKVMAHMDIAERRLPQDGRIQLHAHNQEIDVRVSTIPTNHGESIVMRVLDKSSLLLGLPELGFLSDDQEKFERLLRSSDGILLVTGPTGSGKTSTLYACLNYINKPDRKIITVEEPVEYQMTGINQVQVNTEVGMTFPIALRSILRQAPNIIMIGEIRDLETASIATNASLTGHLVFSTLHTNDAPSAIARLVDIGVQPFLVASSVRAMMAQRLVRRLCTHCKHPAELSETEMRALRIEPSQMSDAQVMKAPGCDRCRHTGYRGRMGIFEIFIIDDDVRHMINKRTSTFLLRQRARELGMRTLREDGVRKVLAGLTSADEVISVTIADVS
jgi:general secretion pathway protein E/type IV pilus assembly protein PilB